MLRYLQFGTCLCLFFSVFVALANNNGTSDGTEEDSQSFRPTVSCSHGEPTSLLSCQNFAQTSLRLIDSLVQQELTLSYRYTIMSAYLSRDDVSHRGATRYLAKAAEEKRGHAMALLLYILDRGGRPTLKSIAVPVEKRWRTPLIALMDALGQERHVNQAFLDLHRTAQQKNDPHLANFLESEFLDKQVKTIQSLSHSVTILTRLEGDAVGVHVFDEQLFNGKR